jgi:hypothetical protein
MSITPGGGQNRAHHIGGEVKPAHLRQTGQAADATPTFTADNAAGIDFSQAQSPAPQARHSQQGSPVAEAGAANSQVKARQPNPVGSTAPVSPTVIPILDGGHELHSSEAPFVAVGLVSTRSLGTDTAAQAAVAGGRETAAQYVHANWSLDPDWQSLYTRVNG